MTPVSEWKWFGLAGHFICGRWCRFHLCTQVGPWLVSTVGQYIPPNKSGSERAEFEFLKEHPNGEPIGLGHFYETMVFRAGAACRADGCDCGQPDTNGDCLDEQKYNTAGEATDGHLKMCALWSHKKESVLCK